MDKTKEEKDRLLALKRVISNLSKKETVEIIEKYNRGEKTGYPTIDMPWNEFYKNKQRDDLFLNTTCYEGLIDNNKDYLYSLAIEYFGAKINYGELKRNIDKTAQALKERGIKKGDFVTVCATTSPEVVYVFYAISKIGAVVNLISPFYSNEEFMNRVNECESKLIIFMDTFYPKFKEILNKEKNKEVVVLPMMNSSILKYAQNGYKPNYKLNETDWTHFIKDGKDYGEVPMDPYEEKKPLAMVYSSGTTGASKGILLSNDSFQKLINGYHNSGYDTTRGQTCYQNVPPWHSTGISLCVNFPLSFGVGICLDPRFEPKAFVDNILKFKPNYITTSITMYQSLLLPESQKSLKNKNLSFLKYPVAGGEQVTKRDILNMEKVLTEHGCSAKIINGYGQCECGSTITTDMAGHKFSDTASGIPLPDITTIGIFDDNYNELKYNERGNILVKTDIGMIEYFNKPEKTKDYFYTDINGEKWSQTGDIGCINEDGSLTVLGRKVDFSIINGIKIYNFDIEAAILKSEYVKKCEVQTHPDDNNKLVAHIVLNENIKSLLSDGMITVNDILKNVQNEIEIVAVRENILEMIPSLFCIKDDFPISNSSKRDVKAIKNDVKNLISLDSNAEIKVKKKKIDN